MIEPILSVKLLFTVSVPLGVAPVPPKMAPPKFRLTAPPTIPVPPNTVPLSLTSTSPVAPVELPLINNVPLLTSVVPR
jgi:hypothetical protein